MYNRIMKKLIFIFSFLFVSSFCFAQKYYVCLGSYSVEKNAVDFQNSLTPYSVPTFIEKAASSDGRTLFRVILDMPKYTIEEARILRDKVARTTVAKEKNLTGLWVLSSSHETKIETPESVPVQNTKSVQNSTPRTEQKLEENKEIPLSEEKPFSLLIESYKDEQVANNDKERLQDKNIDAYVLKRLSENEIITFDLHAGSEDSEEALEVLKTKLDDLNIDYEVSDFTEISDEVEKYDSVLKTQDIVSDDGIYEIPEQVSESVKKIIFDFPINKDFQLDSILIVDVDNAIANGSAAYNYSDDFILDIVPNSFSKAVYYDSLFDNTVNIVISTFDKDVSKDVFIKMNSLADGEDFYKKQDFAINDGILNSWIFKNEDDYILIGYSKEQKILISLATGDLSEEEFISFMENSFNDSTLLVYPQIRRTFCVMPKTNENIFLLYNLEQIDMDYVKEKNYADWSWGMYGHWRADFYFENYYDDFEVAFFDLDYDYNAGENQKLFIKAHQNTAETESNHYLNINGEDGWYVETNDSKEISFSHRSHIIAVDTSLYSILDEEDLYDIADSLLIW